MDVHDHLDWRVLVRAVMAERGWAQRDLAQALGVSEGNVSMLLAGRRSLTDPAVIAKFTHVLFGSAEEAAWFEALVDLQASHPRARRAAEAVVRNTIAHLSAPSPHYEVIELQADWRVSAILELVTCVGFRPDPEWIGAQLIPPSDPVEVAALWERLLALGLVTPRSDGTFDARSVIQPPDLRRRAAVAAAELHEAVLELAAASLHRGDDVRRGGVVTAALSEETAARMRVRVLEMEQELVAMAAEDAGPRNRVFVATLQLFPCTEFTESVDGDEEPGTATGHRPGDHRPR